MSAVGVATGAVAGLVAITPASGFVNVLGAVVIGLGAGLICFFAVELIHKTSLDDALDVFAVHGVGGIWGAIATGIFAIESIGGTAGLIEGNPGVMGPQIIAVVVTIAYSLIVTLIILKVLDIIPGLGLRVTEQEENEGLDISSQGERTYIQDGAD